MPEHPSSTSSPAAGLTGGGSVQVDPASIPHLVEALQSSLDSVGLQIEHAITELRIRPWAGDPVSTTAAEEFNQRSVGGQQDALTALCGYRDQLQTASESLQLARRQYQRVEDQNTADVGSADSTGGC